MYPVDESHFDHIKEIIIRGLFQEPVTRSEQLPGKDKFIFRAILVQT